MKSPQEITESFKSQGKEAEVKLRIALSPLHRRTTGPASKSLGTQNK